LGLSGRVPRRVDAATNGGLLALIDDAVAGGWPHRSACEVLELRETRAWRWRRRREHGRLEDSTRRRAVHGLLDWERAAIIKLFEEWGEIDRSHRKLAHRGSRLGRVFVSPSSVRRTLAEEGPADDVGLDPRVHGHVRHRPALRAARHAPPIRRG
jgi:hypothetical protein